MACEGCYSEARCLRYVAREPIRRRVERNPKFRAIELICALVRKAGGRAAIVGLDTIARRVSK